MSVSVQKRAAANFASIATHIPVVRVAMGLACRCGHWYPSSNDLTGQQPVFGDPGGLVVGQVGHRDAVREVLAVVLRGGADGSPSAVADDLADAQMNYLAACGYRIVGDSAGGRDSNGGRND